jgi:hypothetical protein
MDVKQIGRELGVRYVLEDYDSLPPDSFPAGRAPATVNEGHYCHSPPIASVLFCGSLVEKLPTMALLSSDGDGPSSRALTGKAHAIVARMANRDCCGDHLPWCWCRPWPVNRIRFPAPRCVRCHRNIYYVHVHIS